MISKRRLNLNSIQISYKSTVFEAHNLNKKTIKEILLRLKGFLVYVVHFDSALDVYSLTRAHCAHPFM